MELQGWRSVTVILFFCGVGFFCCKSSCLLAQSKSKNLESFERRGSQPSSISGEFAPGDGVRITVWRDVGMADQKDLQDLGLNGDFLIDSRGYVLLPVIGEVRAYGHTRKTLARAIEDSLKIRALRVICLPLIRVTLLGAVNKPGSYLIEPKDSLWELINLAGGPLNHADIRKIFVQRGGRKVVSNLLESFEQAHSLEQIGVRSGDQMYVPGQSRFPWRTVIDYVQLSASFVLLYFQFSDRYR
jgi:protein involved in polysaccharide export with SLBB domain